MQPAYRVFDDHGEVLALRADMTVPIARLVATRYPAAEPPLRFCYIAHAYRQVVPHRGQMREFLQAGIELVGAPGAAGHRRGAHGPLPRARRGRPRGLPRRPRRRVAVSARCCARLGVAAPARERLLHELATRDLVGLEREVHELGLQTVDAELLVRVPQLRGGAAVLEAAPGPVADALVGLRSVLDLLEPAVAARVIFDLGLSRAAWATTRARSSTSTTPRSASRSAAAGATTTCSGASGATCRPSASRSASTACIVALAGEGR